MGCDGIFEIKTNQEIIDMVVSRMAKKTLKDTAEEILDALLAPSAQSKPFRKLDEYGLDNMTLIIVRFKN
jgi:serine/threonine protein phosphatase PrpC